MRDIFFLLNYSFLSVKNYEKNSFVKSQKMSVVRQKNHQVLKKFIKPQLLYETVFLFTIIYSYTILNIKSK